jgi:hypothetical protein
MPRRLNVAAIAGASSSSVNSCVCARSICRRGPSYGSWRANHDHRLGFLGDDGLAHIGAKARSRKIENQPAGPFPQVLARSRYQSRCRRSRGPARRIGFDAKAVILPVIECAQWSHPRHRRLRRRRQRRPQIRGRRQARRRGPKSPKPRRSRSRVGRCGSLNHVVITMTP